MKKAVNIKEGIRALDLRRYKQPKNQDGDPEVILKGTAGSPGQEGIYDDEPPPDCVKYIQENSVEDLEEFMPQDED